jgi:8-oxo-dGTP pyrophosphatase MutT (NUDIX family)
MTIRKLSSREVYRNRWMTLREDKVARADGSEGIFGVVTKPPFALIIPMDGGFFHLVEQERYPVGGRFWEFPQGTWEERPDATPQMIAAGELREETGLIAGRMRHLGQLWMAYGFMHQPMHVFIAEELEQGERAPGPEEGDLVCHKLPVAEFDTLVADGRMMDVASLSAYALLRIKGLV